MKNKIMALFMAGIISLVFAACGNANNENGDPVKSGNTNELTAEMSGEDKNGSTNEQTGIGDKTGEQTEDTAGEQTNEGQETQDSEEGKQELDEKSLLETANTVLQLMKEQNFKELSKYVSEDKGVRFTPYSSVDKKIDRCLSASEIAGFAEDDNKYMWGYYDGSGFDMMLTNMEYWDQFVWNTDYSAAEDVSINKIVQQGNSIENLTEEYPDASFVEYHFSQLEPKYEGMDWCSLRLVFEGQNGAWKLVAIIHAQWTI